MWGALTRGSFETLGWLSHSENCLEFFPFAREAFFFWHYYSPIPFHSSTHPPSFPTLLSFYLSLHLPQRAFNRLLDEFLFGELGVIHRLSSLPLPLWAHPTPPQQGREIHASRRRRRRRGAKATTHTALLLCHAHGLVEQLRVLLHGLV